jgi:hypothetical protein
VYVFFDLYLTLIKKNFPEKMPPYPRRYSSKTPYWNFWKVIFAGWLIRYPGKVFKWIGVPLGILLIMIYNAITK